LFLWAATLHELIIVRKRTSPLVLEEPTVAKFSLTYTPPRHHLRQCQILDGQTLRQEGSAYQWTGGGGRRQSASRWARVDGPNVFISLLLISWW
jgi:hypothetical protein